MQFRKYHGLGNDYLIPTNGKDAAPAVVDEALVRLACAPHYGMGSDGILYGPYEPGSAFYQRLHQEGALCAFRILNPDGSEAEKSGNGVRIFARYLFDCGRVKRQEPFVLATLGGPLHCRIDDPETAICAEMGRVSFPGPAFPEHLAILGKDLACCAADVGNPHCVVLCPDGVDQALAMHFGPVLECHPRFPHRTNVQFARKVDDHTLQIEIYERGAGYTLASGTSACACAAVSVKLGWCVSPVAVKMPGGVLTITIGKDFTASQIGPVHYVYQADFQP